MDFETVIPIVSKPVCTLCLGKGHIYHGNQEEYDIEPCECIVD